MEKIMNKLLCFMWGHQYDKVWCFSGVMRWGKRIHTEYIAEFKKCIHCGAPKHD